MLPSAPLDQTPTPPRGAAKRRLRFGAVSALLVAAVGASVVLAGVLGDRLRLRIDATATGEQHLAPRTAKLLDALDGTHTILIAAPLARDVDRQVRARVLDVLSEFEHANPLVKSTAIDTSTPVGADTFAQVVQKLIEREREGINTQKAVIELSAGGTSSLGSYLGERLSPALLELHEKTPQGTPEQVRQRQWLEQSAAAARVASRDVASVVASSEESLRSQVGGVGLPATDVAAKTLARSLASLTDQLGGLARSLRAFGGDVALAGDAAEGAKTLAAELDAKRDQAAVLLDPLRRLPRLDILRVADALKTGSAVLVIGPPGRGLAAVDTETLFPTREWLDAAHMSGVDLGRRIEDLFATAIASLSGPPRPIVVLVHADPRPFLDRSNLLSQLRHRIESRGMDLVEWACVAQSEPALPPMDPAKPRPVVYVSLAPDSSAPAGAGGELTGVQRAGKLGEVLQKLGEGGANLLISMNPSISPTFGEADPLNRVLGRFGLGAMSGKPLMGESTQRGVGRVVDVFQVAQAQGGDHAILHALHGLPSFFPWPIGLATVASPEGARLSRADLYSLKVGDSLWAESQWLRYWQTKADERALLRDQPSYDAARDLHAPDAPPGSPQPNSWVIATAVERSEGNTSQRLVGVGSNGWFFDQVTMSAVEFEGRATARYPGNLELFEASVSWLAHQDDYIAQSPAGRVLPVIRPLEHGKVLALRWAVIGGVPALVLLVGAIFRLTRG